MLKEKIIYKDELPINVVTANILEYPTHFHDDMEVVYVLAGSIILKNGCYTYTLRQGDIFILNEMDMHSFTGTNGDSMVMMLQLDFTYFERYYKDLKDRFFVTDMKGDDRKSLGVLRNILARIMMEVLQKGPGYEHKVIESTHNLLACMLSDFSFSLDDEVSGDEAGRGRSSRILSGRLNRITEYMYDNYARKLTLSEIAENEKLSIYYLSHIIKEATGLSFQDLLGYIRVEGSEKLLLGTSKKIGAIAAETGFSAVRYYIKHFEAWYGMHPAEYRKKYSGKTVVKETKEHYRRCAPVDIEEALRKQVKGVYFEYEDKLRVRPVIIDIDVREPKEKSDWHSCELAEVMERGVNGILAEPYKRMKEFGEDIIAAGNNYMISVSGDGEGSIKCMSILVYNFDENIVRSLGKIQTENDILRLARNYDDETEFLIKCNGLSGEFKILRYRLERDNFVKKMTGAVDSERNTDRRKGFIDGCSAFPSITSGTYTSSDMLSIRATFKGMGAELILLDNIPEQSA